MKQTLYFAFLRHGSYLQKANVPSAWQPYPLDAEGTEQSHQAAQCLNDFVREHHLEFYPDIYSSTLLRAWQTAEVLRHELPFLENLISDAALNERSMGALANLNVGQIDEILHQDPRVEHPGFHWKSDSYYRLPFDGTESLMDSGKRVAKFIQQKLQLLEKPNQLSVFVGHGASFRHAAFQMGILEFDEIEKRSMHYAQPMIFKWDPETQKFELVLGEWKQRSKTTHNHNEFTIYRAEPNHVQQELMQWLD